MKSNTADTGGPGRHARDRRPRTAAAPQGGGPAGQAVPGWQDPGAGRHAAAAPDGRAQSTGPGPARSDGQAAGHAPVARRTATGWRVGDEEVSDLTSAMVLADLLAADLPTQATPTVSAPAASSDGGEVPDPHKLEQTVAQLEHALTARVRVEQAIGVLAERHRLRPRQAFELLRSVARAQGRRVLEMATEVVESATNPLLRIPEELAKPPVVRRRGRRLGPDAG
jgi:ANTAR domain